MFTGLIETIGEVSDLTATSGGVRLSVRTEVAPEVSAGDSVAVDGVCLTVVAVTGGVLQADIGPETARVTTLGSLTPGSPVNLERPLRLDARLGGHMVQGHVDAIGRIDAIQQDGESWWIRIAFPASLAAYLIPKGSIAVDGISLTVARLEEGHFTVQVIPHTWSHTTLHARRAGDRVNLECDLIGKYVARALELGGMAVEPRHV